jgi:Protein of unknown function (DUF3307)
MSHTAEFAAVAIALYAAHHVGDYWVQTDGQAKTKAQPGRNGQAACLMHVATYMLTQFVFLIIMIETTGLYLPYGNFTIPAALLVSGVTHYIADRRTPLARIASWVPGKANFWKLGTPRAGRDDNPSLGTGAWALDQSWHIFWGVFVAALVAIA